MKRLKQLFCLAVVFTLLCSAQAYAASFVWNPESGLQPTDMAHFQKARNMKSVANESRRGEIISTGIVEIGDNGDGTLYLCIETYAHENVDRINQTLFLDQWSESRNDWVQIKSWEFSTTKSENGGTLYDYTVEMDVSGCKVGETYRARGLHLVRLSSTSETLSSETDGVELTN